MPVVLTGGVLLLYFVRTRILRAERARCWHQTVTALLLGIYVSLAPITTVIFRGIPCDEGFGVEDESFLKADMTVSCSSNEFKAITLYVWVSILVYPFGVHCLELMVLRSNRAEIKAGRAQHLSFLFQPFSPDYYYYEVVDSVRRIMLTSYLVRFAVSPLGSRGVVAWGQPD